MPAAALVGRAEAAAAKVDPSEPQAKSLGYVEDATKVDAKANPNYKAGPDLRELPAGARARPAPHTCRATFSPGKMVNAKGWCKVYVKRP